MDRIAEAVLFIGGAELIDLEKAGNEFKTIYGEHELNKLQSFIEFELGVVTIVNENPTEKDVHYSLLVSKYLKQRRYLEKTK